MAIGFIVIVVLIGLGVFLVALLGGPRAARRGLHASSRAVQRLFILAATVMGAASIAIPALVLADNGNDKAAVGPGGVSLNVEQQHGRALFAASCATCHTLRAADAVGRIGPNLDVLRPPKALVLDAIQYGRARGNGQMPALLYIGPDAVAVADFVSSVAGR